ncbi:uncharacterized protein [Watersipora subatra]|uniref:uncharacterized protein n=1 Tax=Watersipora subatra TaxID=2589382 RepID=UPI00355BD871
MVLGLSDGTTHCGNTTSHPFPTTYDETITHGTKQGLNSAAAFWSILIFGLAIFVSSGGLLLIFLIHRKTAKHASLIMMSTLANLTAGAFSDLVFRATFFAIGEDKFTEISPMLCTIFIIIPDYFMIAIMLCLPLLSIERLLRLETKEYLTARQTRQLFGCLLVFAYSIAFVFSILPTTNLFTEGVNVRCGGKLVYGYSFSYIYSVVTLISVILTAAFAIAVALRLKTRLQHLGTTTRKKIVLKQGTISAIAITGVLFLALAPFAISLQLVLMCGSQQIDDEQYCQQIIIDIALRLCVAIQKFSLLLLPIVFLGLNPKLRHKVWLTITKTKRMENVVTISTMTTSKDSVTEQVNDGFEMDDEDEEDDDDFITIAEDLSFGKCGDTKGEVNRRFNRCTRTRQSVLDMVDVLSVISERSESVQD